MKAWLAGGKLSGKTFMMKKAQLENLIRHLKRKSAQWLMESIREKDDRNASNRYEGISKGFEWAAEAVEDANSKSTVTGNEALNE